MVVIRKIQLEKENENYAYVSDVTETNNRIYVDFVFHGKSKKVIMDLFRIFDRLYTG